LAQLHRDAEASAIRDEANVVSNTLAQRRGKRVNAEDDVQSSEGKRAAGQGFTGRDRDEPGKYVDVIVFPSYEEAMRNSDLPETQAMAGKMASLCDGGVTFHNLDVVREDNP
jgi:hypothetical protein